MNNTAAIEKPKSVDSENSWKEPVQMKKGRSEDQPFS